MGWERGGPVEFLHHGRLQDGASGERCVGVPEERPPVEELGMPLCSLGYEIGFVKGLFLTLLASEVRRVIRVSAALVLRRLRIHA